MTSYQLLVSLTWMITVTQCITAANGAVCVVFEKRRNQLFSMIGEHLLCDYTIFPEREDSNACNLTVIDGESEECAEIPSGASASYDRDLVRIGPYWTDLGAFFNISFVKSGWRYMKYRLNYTDEEDKPGTFCHEAMLDPDTPYGTVSTSCRLSIKKSSVADLFFTAGERKEKTMQTGHYRMIVPRHDEVDHYKEGNPAWKPIAVLDVTTPPEYRIHWRKPPHHVKAAAFCAKLFDGDKDIWKRKMTSSQCGTEYCIVPVHLDNVNSWTLTAQAPIMKYGEACAEDVSEKLADASRTQADGIQRLAAATERMAAAQEIQSELLRKHVAAQERQAAAVEAMSNAIVAAVQSFQAYLERI